MKNILMIVSLLSVVSFFSCNDDDNNDIDKKTPGEKEIKISFNATESNNTLQFYISGEDISVDWGDGEKTEGLFTNNLAQHAYHKLDKEYIITVKASHIESFGNTTYNYIENFISIGSISKIADISFGNKISIDKLYLDLPRIGNISVPSNSAFVYALVAGNDFNLNNLKNFTAYTELYVASDEDMNIDGLGSSELDIIFKRNLKAGSLNINSCPNIFALSLRTQDYITDYPASINKLTLRNLPSHLNIGINALNINSVDAGEANGISDLSLKSVVVESIIFNDKIKRLFFEEYDLKNSKSDNLKTIDVSVCNSLELLSIGNKHNLEEIKFGKMEKLLSLAIFDCDRLKALDLHNMSNLKYLWITTDNQNSILESVDISDCQSLQTVSLKELKLDSFKAGKDNKELYSVDIERNNLSQNELLELLSSLPDESSVSYERKLFLTGNPGITSEVKAVGNALTFWNVSY